VADDVEIFGSRQSEKAIWRAIRKRSGAIRLSNEFSRLRGAFRAFKGKIMGLSLAFGGHLTHGQPQSATGKFFQILFIHFRERRALWNFAAIEKTGNA